MREGLFFLIRSCVWTAQVVAVLPVAPWEMVSAVQNPFVTELTTGPIAKQLDTGLHSH